MVHRIMVIFPAGSAGCEKIGVYLSVGEFYAEGSPVILVQHVMLRYPFLPSLNRKLQEKLPIG